MLEPLHPQSHDGIVIEFKVRDAKTEKTLTKTVEEAKRQIAEKSYAAELQAIGVPAERIRTYGFAFQGKKVLIG